jgi:formylglycine-generating enzyme required for sulfatase activity
MGESNVYLGPVSAIFISYTGRDVEGDAWADRLSSWFEEWEYGYFRDKDHSHGFKAGEHWRQVLYRELGLARALVCLCTTHFDSSPWCVGEVAIGVKDGKTVIPIQLVESEEELQTQPLPLLLQANQAIKVVDASNPSPEQLREVKHRLHETLRRRLKWRDLQDWDEFLPPYPGLPAFEESQAPVFFGRDLAIEAVVERLSALALRSPGFLLLLGASGYGKSSLVRAGVVPRLRADRGRGWQVLQPFTPGGDPFAALETAMDEAGWAIDGFDPLRALQRIRSQKKAPVVLVIDQFEELLSAGPEEDAQEREEELFLAFLRELLGVRTAGLLVLATMRTDFLSLLQTRWPKLTAMASTFTLEPIAPVDFGELITGPAGRSRLSLQPGLEQRLIAESGGGDALPLLAFTLEKLWKAKERRGGAAEGLRGERWDLTVADYDALGGVAGAVGSRADDCWNPQISTSEEREGLRQAFLDHLVVLREDGRVAKRPARLEDLPPVSLDIVRRLVDDRLLVSDAGVVVIAHEALLRTWQPLKTWIQEGQEELLQRRRVKRLGDELKAMSDQQRRQALDQLAALAAAGGSEERAVRKEAIEPLSELLANEELPEVDREDAALVLALIGADQPLRQCLADTKSPPELRRRAAETLGLLARRSCVREDRQQIEAELRRWLYSDMLNLLVHDDEGWAEHDARLPLLQGASRGLQLAASAELPLMASGPGRMVPMLTLTALEEAGSLRIRTEVVEVPVWMLPLPGGEWLELVLVPAGIYQLGSPSTEWGREEVLNWFATNRDGCKGVDVEALRNVKLEGFALLRFPVSQGQWRSVVQAVDRIDRDLDASPGKAIPENLWDHYAQPGDLAVDSVSWLDAQEWLRRLNLWLVSQWPDLCGKGEPPQLALPSEGQWESACRASGSSGTSLPFHFGATLDSSWARYVASSIFAIGRKGAKGKQSGVNGAYGLVNRLGLAEMHGQVWEWCQDHWHPDPVGQGWPKDGQAWQSEDSDLVERESGQRTWKPLRGGSWFDDPLSARSSVRDSSLPGYVTAYVGFRPCCCSTPRLIQVS